MQNNTTAEKRSIIFTLIKRCMNQAALFAAYRFQMSQYLLKFANGFNAVLPLKLYFLNSFCHQHSFVKI